MVKFYVFIATCSFFPLSVMPPALLHVFVASIARLNCNSERYVLP